MENPTVQYGKYKTHLNGKIIGKLTIENVEKLK